MASLLGSYGVKSSASWGPNHTVGRQAEPWVLIGQGGLATTRRQPHSAPARGRGLESCSAGVPGAGAWNSALEEPGAHYFCPRRPCRASCARRHPSPVSPSAGSLRGKLRCSSGVGCRLAGFVVAGLWYWGRGYCPIGPNPSPGPQPACLPSGRALSQVWVAQNTRPKLPSRGRTFFRGRFF